MNGKEPPHYPTKEAEIEAARELFWMAAEGMVNLVPILGEDGRLGLRIIYNEEEVDRRIEVLRRAGADTSEIEEWHRVRREREDHD